MRAAPSRHQPRASLPARGRPPVITCMNFYEARRNHRTTPSCRARFRLLSWIASCPYPAMRYEILSAMLVTILVLNLTFDSHGQRRNEGVKPGITFVEVPAKASGIGWIHTNGHSPERFLPETVGAGGAFLDFDNDGWMDIYLVNSGPADFYKPISSLKNALYRNNRDGTFTDVTDKAGVAGGRFGMGVAASDYDGDGWHDLFVTNYGPDILYRNNGNGTFTDVPKRRASRYWLGPPALFGRL